jgi:uncharacterized protein (TIGR02118 family)
MDIYKRRADKIPVPHICKYLTGGSRIIQHSQVQPNSITLICNKMYMITKTHFLLLIFAFSGLTACKTSQLKNSPTPETGMFKVSILYPTGDDKTFDMDYYEKKHMPLVAGFLGNNLKFYEINKGIAGRTPADKAPFVAAGYFYIRDVAAYNKAIATNIDTILTDIKKYTNIQPVILISEIKQLKSFRPTGKAVAN